MDLLKSSSPCGDAPLGVSSRNEAYPTPLRVNPSRLNLFSSLNIHLSKSVTFMKVSFSLLCWGIQRWRPLHIFTTVSEGCMWKFLGNLYDKYYELEKSTFLVYWVWECLPYLWRSSDPDQVVMPAHVAVLTDFCLQQESPTRCLWSTFSVWMSLATKDSLKYIYNGKVFEFFFMFVTLLYVYSSGVAGIYCVYSCSYSEWKRRKNASQLSSLHSCMRASNCLDAPNGMRI